MKINIRADSIEVEGYVNAIERNSKPLWSRIGQFVERICKGAFFRALERNHDVHILLNHDIGRDLGSTSQGNLELSEDNIGLHARAVISDPEVVEDARNGNLVGWSFGFYDVPDGVEKGVDEETKLPLRKVRDLDLREVSILNRKMVPAYDGTLIMARSDEEFQFFGESYMDDPEVTEERSEAHSNPIDYSAWDQIISEMKQDRYNSNHDAKTGRFSSGKSGSGGSGGSGGGTLAEKVKAETEKVKNRLSNEPKPFKKESNVNVEEVKSRGGVNDAEAKVCIAAAEKVYSEAEKAEPQITNDVVDSVAAAGGQMYGLDYRMKQPTSMAGKIGQDAKDDGVSFDEAANGIKDAVRYTAVLDKNNFTDGYESIKRSMEDRGYREVRCKNFYEKYENGTSDQKAVQCVYENPKGYKFEFQFHTPESQGAKELNHPLYEEQRKATTTPQRYKELSTQMKAHGTYVPNPEGVMKIRSHG